MDDEKYYEIVALELRSGNLKLGLWTKAISLSFGDDAKAKSMYIGFRVEQLIKEEQSLDAEKKPQYLNADELHKTQYNFIKIIGISLVVLIILLVIYALI